MARTCDARKKSGEPCMVQVVGDASQCWAHDPALAEKRALARRKGGQNKATARRLRRLMPDTLVSVYAVLEAALTDVLDGELDPRQAQAAAALARAMCTILEAGEFEARLRAVEG